MPLPVPNLDDRTFDQLAVEAQSLIPKNFPAWTDHNPSDPGITLLELFAFLVETVIYQINRVPGRSLERFAELLGESRRTVKGQPEAIEQLLRRALDGLRRRYHAVTEEEFETLAKTASPGTVARARALVETPDTKISLSVQSAIDTTITVAPFDSGPLGLRLGATVTKLGEMRRTRLGRGIGADQRGITQIIVQDLEFAASLERGDLIEVVAQPNVFPPDQFVKVIIVPNEPNNPRPSPNDTLRQQVFLFLRPRRLITTRIKVVAPDYTPVDLAVTVARDLTSRLDKETIGNSVEKALRDFLSPLTGGIDGTGWGFGRPVVRSELDQLIESIAGVDHVEQLLLNRDESTGELPLSSSLSLVSLRQSTVAVVDPQA